MYMLIISGDEDEARGVHFNYGRIQLQSRGSGSRGLYQDAIRRT